MGKKIYQHKDISWSYLYLGKAALTWTIKNAIKSTFIEKNIRPLDHAPKKSIEKREDISSILLYSARENIANSIEEYSTLKPDTSSASASGRSNGVLLVSANSIIKNIKAEGKNGSKNQHVSPWMDDISEKLKLPETEAIGIIKSNKTTSYEISCAKPLKAPITAYLEKLPQPAKITP